MTHFCKFAVFCKSPKPHHRSTKIKRRLSCFRFHELETCQCWLVSHTLVVLSATLTALNLCTGRLRVLWYELPVARNLIVNAKRYVTLIEFLKFVFFLLTARPTRHTRLSKSSLGNLNKILNLDHNCSPNPTSSFSKSTYSSPLWHKLNVGLT